MKKRIMVGLVFVMILVSGCEDKVITNNKHNGVNNLWLPKVENEQNECLVYDYYNQKMALYDLKKKKISSVNKTDDFFQYSFFGNSNLFTSGHSSEGKFSIIKKTNDCLKKIYKIEDDGAIYPCACDERNKEYYFNRSFDKAEKNRKIVKLVGNKLLAYVNTGENILDGTVLGDSIYYTVYDEKEDCYFMRSIDKNNYNSIPRKYDRCLDDSFLFTYDGNIYYTSKKYIVNWNDKRDKYNKEEFNYFDNINEKLIQIYVGENAELNLSITDLKNHKKEYEVKKPISFICSKGKITIFCDGSIDKYRTE